jgi:uncharacterized protein YyaL (SSP411 family)
MEPRTFAAARARVDAALLAVRAQRPQPLTDDKTIAAWSGLMAEGLADAGDALAERAFVDAAAQGARFVLERMSTPDGRLLRCWRGGTAEIPAFLEDHANLANACLAIARATGDAGWRAHARALLDVAERLFRDPASGAWYETEDGAPDLFVRVRSTDDGAMPSGTSAVLRASVELAGADGDMARLDRAEASIDAVAPGLREQPVAAIVSMKPNRLSRGSWSSTPMRHLTVTGMRTALRIASTQSATSVGSRMRQAPKAPRCTRCDGQPMFRFTSS